MWSRAVRRRPWRTEKCSCTGKYRFRMLLTPHVPHCWEASLLFEETQGTLFCSDLLHQNGDVEPSTSADVVGRFKQTLVDYQQGPLANYMPYTPYTESTLQRLAALKPKTLGRDARVDVHRRRRESADRRCAGHQRDPRGKDRALTKNECRDGGVRCKNDVDGRV